MINAYAPTSSTEDEKMKQCYDDTERAMDFSEAKYKIVTGDFNAKTETKTKKETSQSREHLEKGRETTGEIG